MLYVIGLILAVVIGFIIAACILAPELSDHEACKPQIEIGVEGTCGEDQAVRHIDIAA